MGNTQDRKSAELLKSKWTIHIYKVWSEEFGTQKRFSKLGYWRGIYLTFTAAKTTGKVFSQKVKKCCTLKGTFFCFKTITVFSFLASSMPRTLLYININI